MGIYDGGPAFPNDSAVSNKQGMTLRQYAAIKLRVPKSGDEWLDDMILDSLRDELAAKAIPSIIEKLCLEGIYREEVPGDSISVAQAAYKIADAVLKERE